MPQRASITDIDELGRFRAHLIKFADEARLALCDAQGEAQRMLSWLQGEAPHFWQMQIRKLTEQVNQAKAVVRDKKSRKTPTGGRASTAVEEKQLKLLQRKLEHAREKLANTKRWRLQLDKELLNYRGVARRAHNLVEASVPAAVAELGRVMDTLDQYTALAAPSAERPTNASPASGSAARPLEEDQAHRVEPHTHDQPDPAREDKP